LRDLRFVPQNRQFAGRGGEQEGVEGLEGGGAGLRRAGGAVLAAFGGLAAEAVAVLPQMAEGALVLAAEHDLVALEELEDAGGVGEGADGFGLDFAVGEAGGADVAGDELLDKIGFHAADAAEAVLGVGHLHDEVHLGGAFGLVFGEVGVAEGDVVVWGFVVEQGGLGEEAVLEGVPGGAGLAGGGFGAGGAGGVGAPGGELGRGERALRPDVFGFRGHERTAGGRMGQGGARGGGGAGEVVQKQRG